MDSSIKDDEKDECNSSLISETESSVEEAFHLLSTDTDDPRITATAVPSIKPKAGQVYLFKLDNSTNAGNEYLTH